MYFRLKKRLKELSEWNIFDCSGGIGRSGTFLTAYGAYSQFLSASEPDFDQNIKAEPLCLIETVKEFRKQRHPWMVEGSHQYQMAYSIILHLLKEICNYSIFDIE